MFAYGAFLIFFKFQQIQFSKSSQFHFTKSSSNRHHKLLPTEYGKNGSHLIFFASTKVSGLRSQFKDLEVTDGGTSVNILWNWSYDYFNWKFCSSSLFQNSLIQNRRYFKTMYMSIKDKECDAHPKVPVYIFSTLALLYFTVKNEA